MYQFSNFILNSWPQNNIIKKYNDLYNEYCCFMITAQILNAGYIPIIENTHYPFSPEDAFEYIYNRKKEKLLIMNNFSLCHNVFKLIQ